MTIDTARCNGKRVLSYIDLNYPFAAATHRPCPGCPDCAPQKSEPDCTEPAPSHVQSMVLRSMADSHSNDEVRSMARELLSARSRIAELEAGLRNLMNTPAVIHMLNPSRKPHVGNCKCPWCAGIALLSKEST